MRFSLKNYDLLGIEPKIYHESHIRKRTIIGGIITIFSVILIVSAIIYFFSEIFLRNSFLLISNQTTDYQPKLDISKFPIMIGLYDSQGKHIEDLDSQVLIIGEFYEIKNSKEDNNQIRFLVEKFKLKNCDLKDFDEYAHLFNKFSLNKYYCIPNEHLKGKTFYGNFLDKNYDNSFLTIKIAKCVKGMPLINDLGNGDLCKTKDEINMNLSHVFLNFLFLDYDIDHSDYENPVKIVSRSETLSLSSTVFNCYHLRKRIGKYHTDSGFIFNNIKTNLFFQYEYFINITDLRIDNPMEIVFGQLIFSLSKKSDNYYRNYMKLQSALANIGGIVEGIFFLFSVIVKFLMKKQYYLDLGIKCFKVSQESQDKSYLKEKISPFRFKLFKKSKNSEDVNKESSNWLTKRTRMPDK